MDCHVYRSSRRPDCYLYLSVAGDFDCLPEGLVLSLGRLDPIMQLELDPRVRLARADVEVVRESLQRSGYYLQLPPPLIPAGALRGRK